MERTTLVRLSRSARNHGKEKHGAAPKTRQAADRGDYIRIYLPPHTPDSGWTCGTAHVWMVHESTLQEFGVDQNDWRKVFVCEHQIEID